MLELCRVLVADVECLGYADVAACFLELPDPRSMLFLLQEGQERLFGEKLLDFQRVLLRATVPSMVRGEFGEDWEVVKDLLKKTMSRDLIDIIESGEAGFLTLCFWYYQEDYSVLNGYEHGSKLLRILTDLGVDAHSCITSEIRKVRFWWYCGLTKKVIYEKNEEGAWVLGWKWTFERYGDEARGLLTELEALMISFMLMEWPFLETGRWFYDPSYELSKDEEARFQRRMANKARKERARAGLKRPRSRMPGSWVH